MSIVLKVEPDVPGLSWKQFCKETEPYSIALDGYVVGGPKFQANGPRKNFNHHEDVDRLATRSTCGQVLMAIRQGFFETFCSEDDVHKAIVHVNDCDEDVCLSWFLLKHGHLSEHVTNPALNKLVEMEDALDATAGAYPYPPSTPTLENMAWIFDPYRAFRLSGELDKKEADCYRGVIEDVERRIMSYLGGTGGEKKLDTRYEVLGGGDKWAMIKEVGTQAKTGAFADGIKAYVSVRERPDGKWAYSVGRMSPFIDFNIYKIFYNLNLWEECVKDRWGGGDVVGGSPRVSGSCIPPKELELLINDVIEA